MSINPLKMAVGAWGKDKTQTEMLKCDKCKKPTDVLFTIAPDQTPDHKEKKFCNSCWSEHWAKLGVKP